MTEDKLGKNALRAGIWYVISNIVVKAISVITTPVFTRILSTEEYGSVQTFISWQTILLPVFSLNLSYGVGRAKLDFEDNLDGFIGSMQLLSALLSAALAFVGLVLIKPLSGLLELGKLQTILLIVYLFFGPAILLFQNGCRYRYKYKQNIAIAWYTAVSTTLLSLLLIAVFRSNRDDMRAIGLVLPTVLLSCLLWLRAVRKKTLVINTEYWKYALRICLPLIVHTLSLHVLAQSDRIFITKIWGKSYTAAYSLAYTYGSLLHVLTTAVSEGWLPWFHDTYHGRGFKRIRNKTIDLVALGCFVSLAGIALSPEAVPILGGSKYARSVMCVPPVILGVLCQFIYTHYVNIELHLKKTLYVSNGTVFAAILNIVLNAIFIPKYGFIAAAYTTLASYFVLMVVHFCITRYILKVKLYNDTFMFAAFIVTALVSAILTRTYNHTLVRIIIILAGFVFFLFYFRKYIASRVAKRKGNR